MARLISRRAAFLQLCCNSSLPHQNHRNPTNPSGSAAGCDAFGALKAMGGCGPWATTTVDA